MNNLETLKNELINQKNILESKNYTVSTANTYPSPSEITNSLYTLMENVPEVSSYATYYKSIVDPTTFTTTISDIVIPDGTVNIKDYFVAGLGDNLVGKVTIPESVTSIGVRSFNETSISEVIFPSNLTSIGSYCFCKCPNIQKIILPDSLTSIGTYSFDGVTEFTELHISEGLTELPTGVFKVANQLTTVTIPANLTKIGTNNFITYPLLENFYLKGDNVSFLSGSIFTTHNEKLKIWVNFDSIAYYSALTNVSKIKDHLISEVTISELTFPTTTIPLAWYQTIEDATTKANRITTPTKTGTYYCTVV